MLVPGYSEAQPGTMNAERARAQNAMRALEEAKATACTARAGQCTAELHGAEDAGEETPELPRRDIGGGAIIGGGDRRPPIRHREIGDGRAFDCEEPDAVSGGRGRHAEDGGVAGRARRIVDERDDVALR